MKFATLRSGQVVAHTNGGWRVVNRPSMLDVIKADPSELAFSGDPMELPEHLAPPIANPSKIWAAAGNFYRVNTATADGKSGRGEDQGLSKQELLDSIFMKPPSAIVGPGDSIVIPAGSDAVYPEVELCIVIGKRCRNLTVAQAPSAIFGYTILNDVTARGRGDPKSMKGTRCVRKGYDTFAPIGPCIVTRDEIPDPQKVKMDLWVNGELRQSASTETMINGIYELVSFLSGVSTLEPGDLITTGTPDSPAHQRKLIAGDVMIGEIHGIGKMTSTVRAA